MAGYRRLASLKSVAAFRAYVAGLGIELPLDDALITGDTAPLAKPYRLQDGFGIGNRFCVQPMEGWDGTPDGKPTALTFRRWRNFGRSGAKLIWGGEAVVVQGDGRANPHQLTIDEANLPALAELRRALVEAHEAHFGRTDDLLVGLQLTHAGRYARPASCILYHHPLLDSRLHLPPDYPLLSGGEIEAIIEHFIAAAEMARRVGFDFVDVKHCHGYLGHEFLSAFTRHGDYGGGFENRTRFLRRVVAGIHQRVPDLRIGVRLSAFDTLPFRPDSNGRGVPEEAPQPYHFAFGCDPHTPLQPQLDETKRFLALLDELGIQLVNLSAGSPYYNPHIQRPALFPPADGYRPPEDPLVGVARQIGVVAQLKRQFPRLAIVGSAYSYLQEWLPYVAQNRVRNGAVDFVGLGRMMLAYPDLAADVLADRPLKRRRLCRACSDCTTAPRHGLVSGCYRCDPFYENLPQHEQLIAAKAHTKRPSPTSQRGGCR